MMASLAPLLACAQCAFVPMGADGNALASVLIRSRASGSGFEADMRRQHRFRMSAESDDLRAIDEQIAALEADKAAAVAAQNFFKAGDLLDEIKRLKEQRTEMALASSTSGGAMVQPPPDGDSSVPADLKAISRIPEAAVRASAKRLAEAAQEREAQAARAKAAAANDRRTPKKKLEDSASDVVSGKSFAKGFGGLFRSLTGLDIRSDELKRGD